MMDKKQGFSLIELIVVITIIIVVSAVGMVSYQAANSKSRDGRRMADLEKIRTALELYRQEAGSYPMTVNFENALVPTYLQSMPEDPKGYSYSYTRVTAYTYTLDAYLEVTTGTGSYGSCGGDPAVTCNYRVTNP